jgi:hypothetical protein
MKNSVTSTKLSRVLIGLALALLLPLAGCGKSGSTAFTGGSEAMGNLPAVVVDASSGSPVAGAVVIPLEGDKAGASENGSVQVTVPAQKPFLFTVSAPGYRETLVGGKLPAGEVPVRIPLARKPSSGPPLIVSVGGQGCTLVKMPEPKAINIVNGRWEHLSFFKKNITAFTGLTAGFALSYFDSMTSHSWKYVIVNANGTIASGSELLDPAHGYWLLGTSTGTLDCTGDSVTDASRTLSLGGAYGSAGQQWNLVGCPYSQAIPLTTVRIKKGSTEYTLADASSNGISAPAFSHFNSDTGHWEYALGTGTLDPNKGYWYLVFQDCSLILPNPIPVPTPPPAPTITSLSPNSGDVGTPVTITGTNFGTTQGDTSTVTFTDGANAGRATTWTDTQIIINVPVGATTGAVTVTVGGRTSNTDKIFTVNTRNWIRQNPLPTGNPIYGVWGSAVNDIFVVGQNGSLMRYNGTTWNLMTSGTTSTLRGIWGNDASNIFAVGMSGAIIRYNGTAWSTMSSGSTVSLYGIWGSGVADIYAAGDSGTIIHWNGTTWGSPMTTNTTRNLRGIWGSAANNIFAVGDNGTVVRYNGTNWGTAPMDSKTTQNLKAVWGFGANVYAVGDNGTVIKYDGTGWALMTSNTTQNLKAVWGTAANNIYALGDNGTVMLYNGTTWSAVASGTTEQLWGLWGSGAANIMAVGGSYNNGYHGLILNFNGTAWSPMTSGPTNWIYGGWGSGSSSVFAVGDSGTVLYYNGTSWSAMASGTTSNLYGAWGSSATDVYAVGNSGTIRKYNGAAWSSMTSGTTANLFGVWGNSSTNIYAVGDNGIIIRYTGGPAWSAPMTTGTTARLNAIWGSGSSDIFAVGGYADWSTLSNYGVILHYDGTSWSKMLSGSNFFFQGVWGSSPTDVYAVGAYYQFYGPQSATIYSKIYHYDGAGWNEMSSTNVGLLNGVWGSGANSVFAVGGNGSILRYDGSVWNAMTSGTTNPLFSIWGSSAADYFSGGSVGTILHY